MVVEAALLGIGDQTGTAGDRMPIVVVGAGMAGLACAVALHEAGQRVLVLEADDAVGGRVRTDRHWEGFLLDRGFQVLLDAYPAVRRWIDVPGLRPAAFDAGALIWTGRRLVPVADPMRHPGALPRDLTTSLFSMADKVRLVALAGRATGADWQSAAEADEDLGDDRSAADELWARGFGRAFVDRFARPFWGGILLDRSLQTSAGPFWFTLKMFLEGRAVLPTDGIQAMPDQLRRRLPSNSVRFGQTVAALVLRDGGVRGVRVGTDTIAASAVVVAADPPAARRLTGIETIPGVEQGVGCLTVYLTSARHPGTRPRLVFDGTGCLTLNHLAPLSVVAPSVAPPGRHLLAAVVIGEALGLDDEEIVRRVRLDVARVLGHRAGDWSLLASVRVPFSQFAQPPGVYACLPTVETGVRGLFLASEATVDSSYNGALLSGEAAARAVLGALPGASGAAVVAGGSGGG